MGTLRTIFALSVVFAHCWPGPALVGGRNAVQLFYIISGFLISYVLVEKRSYSTLSRFYLNRYLRLYPVYCIVAVATLAWFMSVGALDQASPPGRFFAVYHVAPPAGDALLVVANTLLFGQDWVMFSPLPLWNGLLAPQAWTLGLELTFYLIAPFILTRRPAIYCLLVLSVALRIYFVHIGIARLDPWSYRFFPTELAFFLSGALAHQLLLPAYRRRFEERIGSAANLATLAMIAISAAYCFAPFREVYKSMLLFGLFLAALPLIFVFQARHPADSRIGDLSYPLYIGHVLAIWVTSASLDAIRSGTHVDSPRLTAACCVATSLLFALLLNSCVAVPFERIRARLRSQAAVAALPSCSQGA